MGFWVQVAEWVLSSKEDLLGQLQGCLEGDARDPPGWVLPVLLVLLPGDCRLPMGLREDRNTILCDQGDPTAYLPHLKESLLTLEMYSVLGLGVPLPGCPCREGTRAGPVGSSAKKVKLRRAQESLPALVSKDGWGGKEMEFAKPSKGLSCKPLGRQCILTVEVKEGGAVVGCELEGYLFHSLIPFDIRKKFFKCDLKPRATR